MLKRVIFLSGVAAALTLVFPAPARAQMAGGEMGGEEKKDEAPATPKPDDGAKPDAGKADPGKAEEKPAAPTKTVVFEKIGSDWKEGKNKGKGTAKINYHIGGKGEDQVEILGSVDTKKKADFEKYMGAMCSLYQGADGKKLEKSAAKQDSFEAGGLKVKTFEIVGTFMGAGRMKKKDKEGDSTDKPAGKPGQKTIAAWIDGPDGAWVVRMYGPEKAVDSAKDSFIAYVKSAKVVDAKPEEKKDDKAPPSTAPGAPGSAPGAEGEKKND